MTKKELTTRTPNRKYSSSILMSILVLPFLLLPVAVSAESVAISVAPGKAAPTWTVGMTGGFTNTFQMVLGGTYGKGIDNQDSLTTSVNSAFVNGDRVSAFGWGTTDIPSRTLNWRAGLLYKVPLLHQKNHTLSITGGGERWILPLVGPGTKDWLITGNLTYGTRIKKIPVYVSEDSYSLIKSNMPTGSALYSQIYTQHQLLQHRGIQLGLREGPAYTYSWGFYGRCGNRVVRYGGALVASWKGNTLEAGYRKQFGLQDGIPNNNYWSVLFTKQFSGHFRPE